MPIPTITPFSEPVASRNLPAGRFNDAVNRTLSELPRFVSEANDLAAGVEADAEVVASAIEASEASIAAAEAAEQSETNAGIFAAAAQSAAGIPSLAGNAFNVLRVNAAADGVEWSEGPVIRQVFTSSGTFSKEPDDYFYLIEAWTGGQGGRNIPSANATATGGAGGGYAYRFVLASQVAATEAVTIGAGSVGGASGVTGNAAEPGRSSFGSLLTSPRTLVGTNSAAESELGPLPGKGGFLAGGQGLSTENSGIGGASLYGGAGGGTSGAVGGVSSLGGSGGVGNNTAGVKGGNGTAPGGGGGGSGNDGGGGDGARGEVRVWRFKK